MAVGAALVVPAVLSEGRHASSGATMPTGSPKMRAASSVLPAACTTSGDVVTCAWTTHANEGATTRGSVTIPLGISAVRFQVNGAVGAGVGGARGGYGGEINGVIDMTAVRASAGYDNTVTVTAGANGHGPSGRTGGGGGSPGGGSGANGNDEGSGGGGGMSDIALGSTYVAIAGAGGGAGGWGAGQTPTNGGSGGRYGGGGTSGAGTCSGGGSGGGGATPTRSGSGGGGHGCTGGGSGTGGTGHNGGQGGYGGGDATVGDGGGAGGGGGAGWRGGGGGGGGGDNGSGGGGGGGSSGVHGTGWTRTVRFTCTGQTKHASCLTSLGVTGTGTTKSTGWAYVELQWTLIPTSSYITVSAPTTPPEAGQTVTLQASVTAQTTPYLTGQATFYATGTALCTATAVRPNYAEGSSTATCTYPLGSSLGGRAFHVTFLADNTYAHSGSTTKTVRVADDTTTIGQVSVTSKASPTLVLAATVYPAGFTRVNTTPGYAPTSLGGGTVTFYQATPATASSRAEIACIPQTVPTISTSATAGGKATATCRFTGAVSGSSYVFTATYGGAHENTAAGPSAPLTYTVTKATPTVTLATTSSTTPVFGQAVTVRVTVGGLPSTDPRPPGVTLESTGIPLDCTGRTQSNPVTPHVVSGRYGGTCTFVPGGTGTRSRQSVVAAYPGDGQTATRQSAALTFSLTKATATTALAISPTSKAGVPVGAVLTLEATVADGNTLPGTPVDGTVAFDEGANPVSGCSAVAVSAGTATCTAVTAPTTISTLHFTATYCPSGSGTGDCADWNPSAASVSVTTAPDPTSVILSPSATQTNPFTLPGGAPVTVTASVAVTSGSQAVTGTVTFEQNGRPISACGGTGGEAVEAPGAVSCTFVPVADNEDTVVARYTPAQSSLTAASSSAPWYVKVSGKRTSTSVSAAASTPYGVPTTVTATVTSTGSAVPEGTVAFAVGGATVPSCSAQPLDKTGTATCAVPPSALPAGTVTIAADYAYAGGTYAKSTGSVTVAVVAAPTSASVSIGPTSAGNDLVTVTVTNAATGATLSPTGTVSVAEGSSTCTGTLAPASGASAAATCSLPRPAVATPPAAVVYTATYSPANGDFQPLSSPATLSVTPGAACSTAAFSAVWTAASAEGTLALSVDGGGGYGSLTVKLSSVSGPCVATGTVPFSEASLSLFGTTLASASVSGYVAGAQGTGTPVLCLTGGTIGLPTTWSIGSVELSATERLCFSLTTVTGTSGTLGLPSGSLTVSGATIPYAALSTAASYQLTLAFSASPPSMTVRVGPQSPPAAAPYVTLTVTVSKSGSAFTATGAVTLSNLPFLGTPLHGTFSVGTGTQGTITGSVQLTVIPAAATYSPVPGLTLSGIALTLSTTTGLTVTGTAGLGLATNQVTVGLTGNYDRGKWTLTVVAASVKTWKPITGLTLDLTLHGTVTVTTAGSSAVVTYAIQAGTVPTGHSAGTALATWSAGGGVTVAISCVAFAFGVAPSCGAGPTAVAPTDPSLFAQGSITFGAGGTGAGITAGFMGAIDLKTGKVALSYDATAGPASVSPVSGLTLTLDSLSVSGNAAGVQVTGSAEASVSALHTTFMVSFQGGTGALVVSGRPTFRGAGVPLDGVFAYASKAVATYTTGTPTVGATGKVALTKGFNAFAVYHPTAAVAAILRQVDATAGSGAAVVFEAHWDPGASFSFTLTLAAGGGFPFLSLPDTGRVTTAVLAYGTTALSLRVTGAIPVPGAQPAPVVLTLTIGTGGRAGTFTGTATVSKLSIFGQVVTLSGSVKRAVTGAITATVTGAVAGPFNPFPGVPLTLSGVTFTLGTSGISVAATMSVDSLGSLSVTGSLQKIETWSLTVKASATQSWSPVPEVTLSPSFTGTVSDAAGSVTFSLTASGQGGQPLFSLSPGPVTLAVSSVGLGNGPAPGRCTLQKAGDLWLTVAGSLSISIGGHGGSASATGCFDLTAKTFSLSATVTGLSFSALTGHVTFGDPMVTVSEAQGAYQVSATATLTVSMPTGGSLVVRATIAFESGGGFVIGVETNLSQWLGSEGNYAFLYYSSSRINGFTTGDPSLGKIDLAQGLTFAIAVSLPATVAKGLNKIGITLPAGAALKAIGTATFSSDAYQLTVSVSLGSGIQLFTAGGAALVLDSGFLQLTLSPSNFTFGLGLTATLDLPSPGPVGKPSHVALSGELSISDTGVNVALALGHCGSTTTAWFTAFGAPGLTVQCASLVGGITYEFPFVNIGLSGTITSLPGAIANVTGYQDGAPISFAFNLDPFLLKLSIGTKNSTTPALEPLAFVGQGTLIKVYYAELYVAPEGATIGSTIYPAGISMGFQATLFSVKTSILASIGLSPPSITFTATISKITLHGLSIGPIKVVLKASPSTFEFQFTGSAQLGPGSANIGPTLKVGGELSATVQIDLSTSKLSAFISGSVSLTVSAWLATRTCYTATVFPYPCDYKWQTTGFSLTLGKTGFSVTGTGVTLEADGYSVTFEYDGHVSASLASLVRHRRGGRGGTAPAPLAHPAGVGRVAGFAPTRSQHGAIGPVALASTVRRLAPARRLTRTSAPVPPPSGPRLNGGKAVLVPTPGGQPSGGSPTGTSSGGSGAGSGTPASGTGTPASGTGTPTTVSPSSGAAAGSWHPTAPMTTARAFTATATLRDGDVLVAGGVGSGMQVLSSAEVYDPADGRWSSVGSLSSARAGASATVLANGDVLIAGGYGATRQPLRTAELFDPRTATFSATGTLQDARAFPLAEALPDGDVLVAGGLGAGHTPLRSAEVYDPSNQTFTVTGAMASPHAFGAAARLPDGDVLVAGGQDATGATAAAERYDPSSGVWSPAGRMSQPRLAASAAVLADGEVLVVGDGADGDVFDPATGKWRATQGMPTQVTMPAVSPLPGGAVLVAGGVSDGSSTSTAVLYDPSTNGWRSAGSLPSAVAGAAAAALSNGQVLVAGGSAMRASGTGAAPSLRLTGSAALYSPPTGNGATSATRPSGTTLAVVGPSPLPVVVGAAGATVILAGLVLWCYELRRRRPRPTPAPPSPGD